MAYVKEDAYLALKSELDSFKSKVETLESFKSEVEELKGFKAKVEALEATVARSSGRSADNLFGPMRLKSKKASSPLLGDQASRVSLVYRMKAGGDPDKPFPPDFLHNDYWEFVGSIQPTDSHLLDFSGHIGKICFTGVEDDNIPVNWAVCNGQIVTLPDKSEKTLPNIQDKFVLASNETGMIQGGSDTLKTGIEDRNHTHGVNVQGTTHGATLSVGQLAAHHHRQGSEGLKNIFGGGIHLLWRTYPGGSVDDWRQQNTNTIGSHYPHSHNIAFNVTSTGISQDHAHEVTLSETNRPPYVKLRPIMRFF